MSSPKLTEMNEEEFAFLDPGELRDEEVYLSLDELFPADPIKKWVPYYRFGIHLDGVDATVGRIDFRAQEHRILTLYGGYIGYAVNEEFRGRRLAERACRLLLPFVVRHGFNQLWITCTTDNVASIRTLERLGATRVEVVDVPPDSDMYAMGERKKCRYLLDLRDSGHNN